MKLSVTPGAYVAKWYRKVRALGPPLRNCTTRVYGLPCVTCDDIRDRERFERGMRAWAASQRVRP